MARQYEMQISRMTVDKLGVKLYDRAYAVIAELVSNSYDADATNVTIKAPMGQYLAVRQDGVVRSKNVTIDVRIQKEVKPRRCFTAKSWDGKALGN